MPYHLRCWFLPYYVKLCTYTCVYQVSYNYFLFVEIKQTESWFDKNVQTGVIIGASFILLLLVLVVWKVRHVHIKPFRTSLKYTLVGNRGIIIMCFVVKSSHHQWVKFQENIFNSPLGNSPKDNSHSYNSPPWWLPTRMITHLGNSPQGQFLTRTIPH